MLLEFVWRYIINAINTARLDYAFRDWLMFFVYNSLTKSKKKFFFLQRKKLKLLQKYPVKGYSYIFKTSCIYNYIGYNFYYIYIEYGYERLMLLKKMFYILFFLEFFFASRIMGKISRSN